MKIVLLVIAMVFPASLVHAEMRAISESTMRDDPAFVWERCNSLHLASAILRQILRNNPISGRNPSLGSEFDWVMRGDVIDQLGAFRPIAAQDHDRFVTDYMSAFGPFQIPSLVPNSPLYQLDVARCQELVPGFGEVSRVLNTPTQRQIP